MGRNISLIQIEKMPDLSLVKHNTGTYAGLNGLLTLHSSLLRVFNCKGLVSNTSLHLFYSFEPNESYKLKCFLAVCGDTKEEVASALNLLVKHSLIQKYTYKVIDSEDYIKTQLFQSDKSYCSAISKSEIILNDEESVLKPYMILKSKPNDCSRLFEMFNTMLTINSPVVYRVDIYPVDYKVAFRKLVKSYEAYLKKDRNPNELFRRSNSTDDVIKNYYETVEALENEPHFLCNTFCFSEESDVTKMILTAATSDAVEDGTYTISTYRGSFKAVSLMGIENDNEQYASAGTRMNTSEYVLKPNSDERNCIVCRKEVENHSFNFLPTLFTMSELLGLFKLPMVESEEDIGFCLESNYIPKEGEYAIPLGVDRYSRNYGFPVELLNKHAFICGVPGSGKTNTMLHLATDLHRKGIKFLVFEPVKKEYRALFNLGEEMGDVVLFSPRVFSKFPLMINPFEFPEGIALRDHINVLMKVFEGAFGLPGATGQVLDDALTEVYNRHMWTDYDINVGNKSYPTMRELLDVCKNLIEETDFDGELKGNLKTYFEFRLGGMLKRDAGEVFDATISSIKPGEWLNSNAILELENLGNDSRNFIILLLLNYVREELQIRAAKKNVEDKSKVPYHVIFLEEAHNIITNNIDVSNDAVNSKVCATNFIIDMLKEVRALRESIIIADQLPTAMAEAVLKNTDLKIVHRMTAADEREYICSTMSANNLQMENLVKFSNGMSLIFNEKLEKAMEIQVQKWQEDDEKYNSPDDMKIFELLYSSEKSGMIVIIEKYIDKLIKILEECSEQQTVLEKRKRQLAEMIVKLNSISADNIENETDKKNILLRQHEKIDEYKERFSKVSYLMNRNILLSNQILELINNFNI